MKKNRRVWGLIIGAAVGVMACGEAGAWGHEGHQLVGAMADSLLVWTNAGKEIKKILGTQKLQTAALWADCAKGVSNHAPFTFTVNAMYSECVPFQTAAGQKAMVDYVKRNVDACHPAAAEEVCHKQYHYADVAIERDTYARADVGASDHDVVSAINAAVLKLQGGAVPAPFSFKSRKEALRVLAHLVGDIHQPLHVGAIYLDSAGHEVDPDTAAFVPDTKNNGANLLWHGSSKLHGEWDAIPAGLTIVNFLVVGTAEAKLVPVTAGPVSGWAGAWASETVMASHTAFQGLTYGPEEQANTTHRKWPVTEPTDYATNRAALQKTQLVKAGARLAQLLEAVWP